MSAIDDAEIHFRAADGITTVSGDVSQWDSITGSVVASQGTAGDRPALGSVPLLGRGGPVLFDGANTEHMDISGAGTILDPNGAFTIAGLFTMDTSVAGWMVESSGSSHFSGLRTLLNGNFDYGYRDDSGNTFVNLATGLSDLDYAFVLSVASASGSPWKAIVRQIDPAGTVASSGGFSPGAMTLTQTVLGFRSFGDDAYTDNDLYEMLVWDRELTGDESDEASGGEIWDVIDYLSTDLPTGGGGGVGKRLKYAVPGIRSGIIH